MLRACSRGDAVEIAIVDTGIGVSREAEQLIFDDFRQLDSSETRVYPVPQKAPHVSAGMNVLSFLEGQCPKSHGRKPVVRGLPGNGIGVGVE